MCGLGVPRIRLWVMCTTASLDSRMPPPIDDGPHFPGELVFVECLTLCSDFLEVLFLLFNVQGLRFKVARLQVGGLWVRLWVVCTTPCSNPPMTPPSEGVGAEREFFIEKLLVQIRCIIVMIRWTGLALWEFEFPFPGSLTSPKP